MKNSMNIVIIIVCGLLGFNEVLAQKFNEQSFCQAVKKARMPGDLSTWVCIAKAESNFNNNAVSRKNRDGSRDFGILQLNSKYWCKDPSYKGRSNSCNINCNALLGANIDRSLSCAAKVYRGSKSFRPWSTYSKCKKPKRISC